MNQHWYEDGLDANVVFSLEKDGGFSAPVFSSPNNIFSVRKLDGTLLQTDVPFSPPSISSDPQSCYVTVPATANDIAVGAKYERRILDIQYEEVMTLTLRKLRVLYYVSPYVPLIAVEQDVRDVFGIAAEELPDDSIELVSTYFKLLDKYGDPFEVAIKTDSVNSEYANRLVTLTECLRQFPSLQARIRYTDTSEVSKIIRFNIDFDKLKDQINQEISGLIDDLGLPDDAVTGFTNIIFGVSAPLDPITGSDI